MRMLFNEKLDTPQDDSAESPGRAPGAEPETIGKVAALVDAVRTQERAVVRGKFLFVGDEKFWVKGVTYGTFAPRADGAMFPDDEVIDRDFQSIAMAGFNTVRTYTPPPRSLLQLANRYGLRVMVGLSWSQHVAFLDDAAIRKSIRRAVREGVNACANDPAVLCYTIGNEIPAPIVRWHGREKIESFLRGLCRIVKSVNPEALITYVNYPTTEYLQLDFVDFHAFNVYLETPDKLTSYLARLQNIAGEKPLVLAELGLDSRRNGEEAQAEVLDWQLRSTFAAGCAGACVFAWTDEWYRGGNAIEDWDFGLTARDRSAKRALARVERVLREVPFEDTLEWPLITVVVCSLNGEPTIRDTMEGLCRLEYPNFEVIVVDDGSTDATASIAREYPWRVISTENRGLSAARNTGWQEAQGKIVAYIDDDAYPDPHWLTFLAYEFMTTDFVGVGGPNLAPAGDGWIADCVANAPGGPVHVLTSDTVAEHIPGCNMSFRREALAAINGFDPVYRAAGDDVDLCWRLQERGGVIGFAHAAMVWHHRRNSVSMYWKQQQGYGKAEALLEEKWPQKYNALGHLTWTGKLYGKGLTQAVDSGRWRIYHGPFGMAPFQSLYERGNTGVSALPLMPEWFLLVAALAATVALGVFWQPLLALWPVLALAIAVPVAQAAVSSHRATFTTTSTSSVQRLKMYGLTFAMHLLQPLARLRGRLRHGLRPWRTRAKGPSARVFQQISAWRETWQEPAELIRVVQSQLEQTGCAVRCGQDYDDWDMEIRCGLLGALRVRAAAEEHAGGKQLLRFKSWPRMFAMTGVTAALLGVIAIGSGLDGALPVTFLSGLGLMGLGLKLRAEWRSAAGLLREACGTVNSAPQAP
jgi:GT2 family glycosyltransferase/membrane protein implicated in regulation of membrane protease activity